MAEEGIEVRGAHEEALEHAVEHRTPMAQEIALFSAILATLGAVLSFLGGHTQNEALLFKNDAVLQKARASDVWAYYQAERVKQHITEAAPVQDAAAQAKIAKYRQRSDELQREAQELDRKSEESNKEASKALSPHTKLSLAVTMIQIAIALASIAALTRKRWLLWGAGGFGALGAVLGALAYLLP